MAGTDDSRVRTDRTLVTWIGRADLDAAGCSSRRNASITGRREVGPVGRVLGMWDFRRVYILSDWARDGGKCYLDWLSEQAEGTTELTLLDVDRGPVQMDRVYRLVREVLDKQVCPAIGDSQMFFLLGPGMPVMGSVWVLLADRYNAVLLDSSREHGVVEVEIYMPSYEKILLPGLRTHRREPVEQDGPGTRLLLAWLGNKDRGAPGKGGELGPVAGFLTQRSYPKVILLYEKNDAARRDSEAYCRWLSKQTPDSTKVRSLPVHLKEKTVSAIFEATKKEVRELHRKYRNCGFDFMASSGMPYMRIAWMLIATEDTSAELWETYRPKGGGEEISRVVFPLVKDHG